MSEKTLPEVRKRTMSRLIAIQIFYQYDFFERQKDISELKNEVLENYALDAGEPISSYRGKIDEKFLDELLAGILQHENEIISIVSASLKEGYSLQKIEEVLQHLILLGAFEIKNSKDTPIKIIINEYVDIAASFFPEKKITFVNGLLENLGRKIAVKWKNQQRK